MSSQRIIGIILRHLYLWPRTLERLVGAFGWPIFDLIIWGLTSSYLMKNSMLSVSLVTFMLGAIIFWTITWRIQNDVSVNLLDDAWNKNLINIFASPISQKEYIIALIILSLIKVTLTLVSLIILAFFLYHFDFIQIFGLFIPVLILNLLLFGWGFGFFVNGLIVRYGYTVAELAWALIALIQPFSCVFYPLSSLPLWAQNIAKLLPTTYVFEEMRRILFVGNVNWLNLLLSFGLNILYIALFIRFYLCMFEKARVLGRLVKLN